jgi:hypothetical protein
MTPFTPPTPGLLKVLVDTHFLEQVILTEALKQDAARIRVGSAEVRKEVDRIREQYGLKDKKAYEQFLNQVGYTDAQLRAEIKGPAPDSKAPGAGPLLRQAHAGGGALLL